MAAKIEMNMGYGGQDFGVDLYMGSCSNDGVTCDLIKKSIPDYSAAGITMTVDKCDLNAKLPGVDSGARGMAAGGVLVLLSAALATLW